MDIQIFDNGGRTDDRYCLIVDNRNVYIMTADPLSPQGFRYFCDAVDLDRKEAGRLIKLRDLPKKVRKALNMNGVNWFGKEAA